MIISHKHKFIFMHSRKCAGSSMEVMLNKYLGPHDIQIGSWPETIQAGGKMNKRAIKDAFFSPVSWSPSLRQLAASIVKGKKTDISRVANSAIKKKYSRHLGVNSSCPPAELVMDFDTVAWEDYFKFSFTRNPFDFEVSDYFWRTKGLKKRVEFKEFLRRKLDDGLHDPEGIVPFPTTNWPIYTIKDDVSVDYIGRFEDLENEVRKIGERIGLPLDINAVPKAKSTFRKAVSAQDLYDEETKEMVSLLHKKEFDMFGYGFPF